MSEYFFSSSLQRANTSKDEKATKHPLIFFLTEASKLPKWNGYGPFGVLHHSSSSEDFIDLNINKTFLYLLVKITNLDGTDLGQHEVGIINFPVFKHYRVVIECLLNYGKDTLDSQFVCGLFIKDTTGHMVAHTPLGDNQGLEQRSQYTLSTYTFHGVYFFKKDY